MDSYARACSLSCWFVFPWDVINRNMWEHSCWIVIQWFLSMNLWGTWWPSVDIFFWYAELTTMTSSSYSPSFLSFVCVWCVWICVWCVGGGRACQRPTRPPCVDFTNVTVYVDTTRTCWTHVCVVSANTGMFWIYTRRFFSVTAHFVTRQPQPQRHTHDNGNDTQRHQLTKMRLNYSTREKSPGQDTAMRQTTMRQIDSSSFVFSVMLVHDRSLLTKEHCLVKPVNAPFLSMPNGVKYDSSFCSFSASWQVNRYFWTKLVSNFLEHSCAVLCEG